jgi:hypothetical protein
MFLLYLPTNEVDEEFGFPVAERQGYTSKRRHDLPAAIS